MLSRRLRVSIAPLLVALARTATPPSYAGKFGMGIYNDSLRPTPLDAQLPVVANLTGSSTSDGAGGWVVLYFYGDDYYNASAGPRAFQVAALAQALALNLRPVLRLEGGGPRPWRDLADDAPASFRNFSTFAANYARWVSALVLAGAPGRAADVVAMYGNEVNICVEYGCDDGPSVWVNASERAAEWGSLTRDIGRALRAAGSGVSWAAAPLAPGGDGECQCSGGGSRGGSTTTEWLAAALAAAPDAFSLATHFAAHPYPSCCTEPLSSPCNSPPTWVAAALNDRLQAVPSWATGAGHNASAARAGAAFRMLVTETGFCGQTGPAGEAAKAASVVQAYEEVWGPEPAVAGVMHFALACQHWDVEGWTWARFNGTNQYWPDHLYELMPDYFAVQALARSTL